MTTIKSGKNTGDTGYCFLISGRRVKKNNKLVKTYAAIDDAICHLGFLKTLISAKSVIADITKIQKDLFLVNACLCDGKKNREIEKSTRFLDTQINKLLTKIKPRKKFIIPGINRREALTHIARSKVRIAEITAVDAAGPRNAIKYLNRLSKYLFLLGCIRNPKF